MGETILTIDDKIILEMISLILNRLGYNTLLANNGQSGIDTFKEHKDKISLVILDMIMPGMSGGETFDKLKEINPDVKVILSSGYSPNGDATSIMNRGCKGFIQKPYTLKEISNKIREVLE